MSLSSVSLLVALLFEPSLALEQLLSKSDSFCANVELFSAALAAAS